MRFTDHRARQGTVNLETEDVVEFQPDGSISLNGTFDVNVRRERQGSVLGARLG